MDLPGLTLVADRRFYAAYIRESPRPDCLPSHRFRVMLPWGAVAYAPTADEAERILADAVSRSAAKPGRNPLPFP